MTFESQSALFHQIIQRLCSMNGNVSQIVSQQAQYLIKNIYAYCVSSFVFLLLTDLHNRNVLKISLLKYVRLRRASAGPSVMPGPRSVAPVGDLRYTNRSGEHEPTTTVRRNGSTGRVYGQVWPSISESCR